MKKLLLSLALLGATACGTPNPNSGMTKLSDFRNYASTNTANLLEGVALNAAAASRTITLSTAGFTSLRVFVFYTNSAATTVTATPTCSRDGTNYTSVTSRAVSAGTGTVDVYADSNAVSGDEDFNLQFDVSNCVNYKILFGGASAGAGDLVDVQALATVGGG